MPDYSSGEPRRIWRDAFKESRLDPRVVRRWVRKLHNNGEHEQVIALIQAALIAGQSQPWMYEVLALSMEIQEYPKESIERVVLSLTDFGQVDFSSMMYSGAYLTRLGRREAALKMYRQSSRMLPERSEPYVLGLKLALDHGTTEDVEWAATGILQHHWSKDYQQQHRKAETAVMEKVRRLKQQGDEETADRLQQSLAEARSRDLMVRLDWNGDGDLDLYVEEPPGTVCSFETPLTQAGGIHLHDGYGPDPKNCYEIYVCPRGVPGPYRIIVRHALGQIVGDRAVVTVTLYAGLPEERKVVRTLNLEEGEASLTIDLDEGRRTMPRDLSWVDVPAGVDDVKPAVARGGAGRNSVRVPRADRRQREAMREYLDSRRRAHHRNTRQGGAFAVAPGITVIPEGTTMAAQAIISADRRYVRLSVAPMFNNVTDVFTFSFINTGGP
jgi:hypothetical protein